MRHLLLTAAALVVFLAMGCTDRSANRFPERRPAPYTLGVVYGPVAIGSLSPVYPAGAMELAHGVAGRVDLLDSRRGYDALVAELPPGGDTSAVLAQLGDRDFLLLPEVVGSERVQQGTVWFQRWTVDLTAVDRTGQIRAKTKGSGSAPDVRDVKLMAPSQQPESIAVRAALYDANDQLLPLLLVAQVPAAAAPSVAAATSTSAAVVPVTVMITSDPDHADVLVDGRFIGTTPVAATLPSAECTVRIERQGYRPWERRLIPASDMQLSPALTPEK